MELTDRLSTLRQQDQIRVVERLFQKLSMAFGNHLLGKWKGFNMQDVYEDWAVELSGFTLGQIDHGIKQSKLEQHPPSLGEFISHCKTYQQPQMLKLAHKLTLEEIEKNRARIAEIASNLAKRKSA